MVPLKIIMLNASKCDSKHKFSVLFFYYLLLLPTSFTTFLPTTVATSFLYPFVLDRFYFAVLALSAVCTVGCVRVNGSIV